MASNKPTPPKNNPDPGRGSRPLIPGWAWWVIFGALLAWNVVTFLIPHGPATIDLSYTAFLQQVQAGNVHDITVSGQSVDGNLKSAIPVPATPMPGSKQTPPATVSTVFHTVLPPGDTALPLALLETKGVVINAVDSSGGSWLVAIAVNALPLLLLVGLMLYMGRQMQQGQQSALGFGRSRARVYNAEKPPITFADVAGEDEAKSELTEVVDFLKNPSRYHTVGAKLPHGVLLVGPPGTGKTLLARAVAGEAGVPFFSISASEFVELFVGVGASRVRDLFDQAKQNAPSIVFVDELDAVGRQRGAGVGGGNDEREQTLNQMLVAMDGFDERQEVVVIAATNRPDVLDPALLRPGRFDRQVTVGLPDRAGRNQILRVHSRGKPIGHDVDLDLLARQTPGFSGADLANLVNEAALQAARGKRAEIVMTDFEEALDKIVLGVERRHLQSEQERRVVAYHEAGHALVAVCTPGSDPVQKVTIIPRGRALGVTAQVPVDDRWNYPRAYLRGRLAVLLGGRAAEEIVFNEPTTGAENDLEQATKLARRMVASWGMVDEIGPVHFDDGSSNVFLGRELVQTRSVAEQTAAKLDTAVVALVREAHDSAVSLVSHRRDALDRMVEQLLEHETISGDTVREIVGTLAEPALDGHPGLEIAE
ncbi:MAG TPA: ATP-dependent zinc metalloprotease FtsH [Chloroflexota bacterium]|nr:ATP-dependent zinc metalloprotease FtsH [Chloroflexota bacterium]